MFSRKNKMAPVQPRRKGAELASKMGMVGMLGLESHQYCDADNDEELEAELLALQGNAPAVKKSRAQGQVSAAEFDAMLANSLKNVDNEELSDTEDPDLLNELLELEGDSSVTARTEPSSPKRHAIGSTDLLSLLEERLQNYHQAMENAKSAGHTSKQKRTERGIKTIEDLLKKAQQGKTIDEDDIPPTVVVTAIKSQTQPPIAQETLAVHESESKPPKEPPVPTPLSRFVEPPPKEPKGSHSIHMSMLVERRDQYKKAALTAKHHGDITAAKMFMNIFKQFDVVILAIQAGEPVDLSNIPPPPPEIISKDQKSHTQGGVPMKSQQHTSLQQVSVESTMPGSILPPPSEEDERNMFHAPDPPKTVLEALQQRRDKYISGEQQAKDEGNDSKSRRMSRIAKQYQKAISDVKAGKRVDFDVLPTPPGFAPIPIGSEAKQVPASVTVTNGTATRAPTVQGQGTKVPHPSTVSQQPHKSALVPPGQQPQPVVQTVLGESPSQSRDQQIMFLRKRMQEYRIAAVTAKKNNDITHAKQYLRIAKGFEPMIEASESGLPVDMSKLPPPLETENNHGSNVMVTKNADVYKSGDRNKVFQTLKQDLIAQIRACTTNSSYFTKLGDIVTANKFQKLEIGLQKDLDALNNALLHNDPVPQFHYENKTFSMVQCNADLSDNDLELTIVRGVQYSLPTGFVEKDLDTFVKYEFPYPTEKKQLGCTGVIKGSFNPEYQKTCKLQMDRKLRAFLRVIERKALKLDICYRRGLFKGDKLLGTVNVKLLPLETMCTIHNSYDLADGHKSVGGKLEIKLRIREPFKSKQVEEVTEKWLIIDQFIKMLDKHNVYSKKAQGSTTTQGPQKSRTCTLM